MERIRIYLCGVMILGVSLIAASAMAQTCKEWVAKVVSTEGAVQARRPGETEWQPVKFKNTYCPGDMIRVLGRSRADIVLMNETILRLDQNTTVTFSKPEKEEASWVDLLMGAVYFFSRRPRSLKVVTPFVNGFVEGTEFYVRVEKDHAFLSIFEGQVAVVNKAGSLMLMGGQSAVAREGQAPALRLVANPRDAVRWTLYYPPILYDPIADLQGGPPTSWQTAVQHSVEFYMKGDFWRALESLPEGREEDNEPRFFIYRASLLLSVGRVDEAKLEIEKALHLAANYGPAFALQAVIAVAQNEKEKALSLARKAIEADPRSASPRIGLSYALQALFDLRGARTSLEEAVALEPGNGLAWARLAELWLSFGDLDETLKAARKAADLNPNVARTQTVLGFAYLTQMKTKASMDAFEKAIELDQADPLPRLGLGLAKIRESDLHEGRSEIEIAASLAPDNSLIRSYLGKAYYEERRDKLAGSQFDRAKEIDPLDPTAFFYDAIRKQSLNQPVEALYDLQESISLNDNRAIYRSRLLLDADLAARSASLARIYSDLGFQQLALVEGWRSLNIDPGNFSAHRFLADSYAALPRHEIARVSELLQSQLLQPINITPIQPHLEKSNLFILNGAGPAALSFNEFNPLFNRNRLALQTSGIVGGQDTWGEEVVQSGVWGRFSYSIGQFHYETDGFRKNDDLKENIYNAFAQMSLSYKTSVQAEFRASDTERGDLEMRFFPNDFFPNLRQRDETRSVRLGFHHAFSPGSDLIGYGIYQNGEFKLHQQDPYFVWRDKEDDDSYGGEVQYLFRRERFNMVGGVGWFNIDGRETSDTLLFLDPPLKITEVIDHDIRHTNLYLYSQISYPKSLTWTVGGSADFFKGGKVDRSQFNPKVGVTWNPFPGTTLRGAIFKVLKRTLISNQTLEPTQVAGFNQFFDDINATKSWLYGIAMDQKLSKAIYAGVEYSKRDLEVPVDLQIPAFAGIKQSDWKEHIGRAYLYWAPHPWFALRAEYLFERFERESPFVAGIEDLKTHRFPVGINFHHPSGLSATLRATYINQRGRFVPQGAPLGAPGIAGEDDFWVVDAAISYRLPKRYGVLTVGARNLLNESFKYRDTDPVNPAIQPKCFVYSKFTLAF